MDQSEAEQVIKVTSRKDFYTRAKANEGELFPLYLRSGEKTDQWLRLLGIDSDAYRDAQAQNQRHLLEEATLKTDAEKNAAYMAKRRALYGALVCGWSFPEKCTPEAVREFLTEAPHIEDAIRTYALEREGFFTRKPEPSSLGQKSNSGSDQDERAQSKP